jgi:hypothetical protein
MPAITMYVDLFPPGPPAPQAHMLGPQEDSELGELKIMDTNAIAPPSLP